MNWRGGVMIKMSDMDLQSIISTLAKLLTRPSSIRWYRLKGRGEEVAYWPSYGERDRVRALPSVEGQLSHQLRVWENAVSFPNGLRWGSRLPGGFILVTPWLPLTSYWLRVVYRLCTISRIANNRIDRRLYVSSLEAWSSWHVKWFFFGFIRRHSPDGQKP